MPFKPFTQEVLELVCLAAHGAIFLKRYGKTVLNVPGFFEHAVFPRWPGRSMATIRSIL
jgi:hypothetical protein